MAKNRRKHYKIEQLPKEIVTVINNKLTDGCTYEEIAEWIKSMGHDVGKSSVGRYGKDFLSRLERLKVVKEQAKTIVENNDGPTTQMAEAANQLAMQLIMETLMKVDNLEGAKITELFKAISLLERSGVAREKLKYEFDRGVSAAAAKIKENLRSELASNPGLLIQLENLVDATQEQVTTK